MKLVFGSATVTKPLRLRRKALVFQSPEAVRDFCATLTPRVCQEFETDNYPKISLSGLDKKAFRNWTDQWVSQTQHLKHTDNSRECEVFARAFVFSFLAHAYFDGVPAQPLAAVVVGHSRGGGGHAVAAVAIRDTWQLIEPRRGFIDSGFIPFEIHPA